MRVSVQFEDRRVNECSFHEAQQLLRLGLAEVDTVYPLSVKLKQYQMPKRPDNDAGTFVLSNGPKAPSEVEDAALNADCVN
jgi:hypothetical protein